MIVKVCGVRTAEIALCAVEAGADWLGIVFDERSPRHAGPAEAARVVAACAGRVDIVGVLVEPPAALCDQVARRHRLAAVQVHGRIAPGFAAEVNVAVIRAVNAAGRDEALCLEWWPDCLVLLDSAPSAGGALPGGTGLRVDLDTAAEVARHRPIVLAGGLDPDNVGKAIARVRPLGVDASSGLESAPGVKDPGRVRDFVLAARSAFAATSALEAAG